MRQMATKLSILLLFASMIRCGPSQAPAASGVEADHTVADTQPVVQKEQPRLIIDEPNPLDDLLNRLERSTADLRDFKARVVYYLRDSVLDRKETRSGELIYQRDPDGSKRFAILLRQLIIGDRSSRIRRDYVFDGSWLVEIDHVAKVFIKRQIVPPGQRFDPLKLGEGPFPMPIGQPKEQVRARFEVDRLTTQRSEDELLVKRLGDRPVEGMLLVPRPDAPEAKDIARVEVFYDSKTLLPVGISVEETNGDRKTVILTKLRRNEGIDPDKLNIQEPDPREWDIDVRPWQE